MKLKKEIQAIKELNEQEKQAQAAKAAAAQVDKISKSLYFTILGKCCGRCSGMAISRTGSMMSMGGSCTKAV